MLKLFRTKIFLKEYAKIKFTDKLYMKYIVYVTTLLKEEDLPLESRNNQLKGNWNEFCEFHISGDLLVIYKIKNDTLYLTRIGTHSQLFT
ncbi:type II toxin-antitoxin system YafQ family toxin [Sulfurimonas sp. SAG-AH-194-I05]|nr:type II toxin-antitoxin system YafQ family toxin [Sulfurimonas sp. SAG-AH-194-I05]MDF1875299.1 type II toxin-antitoxin system YafQ family toxin [Sulfurimonas sp. SAG-AH-194-I05]